MKALEENTSSALTFIISDSEKKQISQGTELRTKKRILEHIKNGTDIIMVTSAKYASEPISLERYFSDNDDQVRTIALNSQSFMATADNTNIDLSMISAVVYESIHLDTHFAIIIDDADQFPLPALNELIKLALGINTSKNNVNFIFSGGPNLLSTIEQVSGVKRLSLAHCSLDGLTEDDVNDFVDLKQNSTNPDEKLQLNKYALKKISTMANGSLLNASKLLEWCRRYSQHRSSNKITVKFIDELINNVDNTSLLSGYPPENYIFSNSSSINTENVEFKNQQDVVDEYVQSNKPDSEKKSSNMTVYIETGSSSGDQKNSANVYEKFMHESQGDSPNDLTSNEPINNDSNVRNHSVNKEERNYTDTYLIDALEHINDPLPVAPEDLPLTHAIGDNHPSLVTVVDKNPHRRATTYTLLALCMLGASYFIWAHQLIDTSNIKSIIPSIINEKGKNTKDNSEANPVIKSPVNESQVIEKNDESKKPEENKNTIEALVQLAHTQIDDKKLTTPIGDNAFETFNLILEFQPRNKQALKGIEKIKNRYRTWAELDINEGKIKRAKYFLSRAIEIAPHDKEAKQLLATLE